MCSSEICGITTDVPREKSSQFRLEKRSVDTEYVGDDDYDQQITDDDTRIVNGYKAKNRPWLVAIFVGPGLCGGVLINNL